MSAVTTTAATGTQPSGQEHRGGLTPRQIGSLYAKRQAFDGLTGYGGDQVVVLVDVQHDQISQLGGRGDEQVRYRWCPVLTLVSERLLHRDHRSSTSGVR